jgi:hypothetical protein
VAARDKKLHQMKQRKDNVPPVRPPAEKTYDAAFDVWLQRSLHKLFDDVTNEPIPEELLRLIEENRSK